MRRPLVLAAAALLTWPMLAAAGAAPGAPSADVYDSGGATMNILPPGSNGTVNAGDFAALGGSTTATATQPPNYANQLEMYDALTRVDPKAIKFAIATHWDSDHIRGFVRIAQA